MRSGWNEPVLVVDETADVDDAPHWARQGK
jgi:hypothetical protein